MAIDIMTFAHAAEAQSFIDGLNLSKEDDQKSIYKKFNLLLLITGQGMDNVQKSLNSLISRQRDHINQILNFGVAGKLDQNLPHNEVFPIKSVFSLDGHSYMINRDRGVNCVTSSKVISDEKTARDMAQFGQIVDMELFAIAEIASKFNIHLSAYKILSDDASQKTQLDAIKANAKLYSDVLYKYYIEYYKL